MKVNYRKMFRLIILGILLYLVGNSMARIVNHFQNTQAQILYTQNWGLGFSEDGKPPTGNTSAEVLKKYDAYYIGDTDKKEIYLTFDAGFENGNTPAILEALKKHQVTATFFIVGNYLETEPELVKRMCAEGHIIGNHSYHHPDMTCKSEEEFTRELQEMEEKYKEITGKDIIKLYRPPQGKYNEQTLQMAKDMGYRTFFWSLAYVDWYEDRQPTKEEAFQKLVGRIHPGAIVLLHSTSSTNAAILDELLTKWEEMGYEIKPLTKIA